MRRRRDRHPWVAALVLFLTGPPVTSLTTILKNARVYTVDDSSSDPWAEAVAIDDRGFLMAVGTSQQVMEAYSSTRNDSVVVVDLEGRLVLPSWHPVPCRPSIRILLLISLERIVPMLTLNSAILLQHADTTGSLQVGKAADLVVLDQNIFDIPIENIGSTKVLLTMLQGRVIFDPEGIIGAPVGSPPPAPTVAPTTSGTSRMSVSLLWIGVTSLTLCGGIVSI